MINISPERFEEARAILNGKILFSPILKLNIEEKQLLLKADCLQPSGSFKIRGATFCLSQLTPEQRNRGVVAYSTGNHAQAVALAAQQLGIKATIVMSPDVPDFKVKATKSYGAEVIIVPAQERSQKAKEISKEFGKPFIPPFNDPNVITGQGTAGLEILEQVENAKIIFVPVGGGGLISGIAMAVKQKDPKVKIIGVEPELEDDGYRSFKSGKLVALEKISESIADAVRVPSLGDMTFPIICHYVDEMVTVSEEEIAQAALLGLKAHVMVEPAGALSIAGALKYGPVPDRGVVCMVSGGNTTLEFLHNLQARPSI